MHIFQDRNGKYFVLLPEVREHIIEGHPEMEKYLTKMGEVLASPTLIYQSNKFTHRHLYYKSGKNKLFFTVVVDIKKNMIKTFYITDRIKEGVLIWQEKK
jgi:hypothetical protein